MTNEQFEVSDVGQAMRLAFKAGSNPEGWVDSESWLAYDDTFGPTGGSLMATFLPTVRVTSYVRRSPTGP